MKRIIFPVLLLTTFAAFGQEKNTSGPQLVLIRKVTGQNKMSSLVVDYVTMLTGAKALKAAKQADEAEYELTSKGDTTWYVPNDYYIENKSQQLRTLPLAAACAIQLIRKDGTRLYKSNLAQLKKAYADKLYELVIASGKVIKITEVYTP